MLSLNNICESPERVLNIKQPPEPVDLVLPESPKRKKIRSLAISMEELTMSPKMKKRVNLRKNLPKIKINKTKKAQA